MKRMTVFFALWIGCSLILGGMRWHFPYDLKTCFQKAQENEPRKRSFGKRPVHR